MRDWRYKFSLSLPVSICIPINLIAHYSQLLGAHRATNFLQNTRNKGEINCQEKVTKNKTNWENPCGTGGDLWSYNIPKKLSPLCYTYFGNTPWTNVADTLVKVIPQSSYTRYTEWNLGSMSKSAVLSICRLEIFNSSSSCCSPPPAQSDWRKLYITHIANAFWNDECDDGGKLWSSDDSLIWIISQLLFLYHHFFVYIQKLLAY